MKSRFFAIAMLISAATAGRAQLTVADTTVICIHSADIDKLEIVKGRAAAQEYGDKGVNGIVVVTLPVPKMHVGCTPPDPLAKYLYSPDEVLPHMQELGFTDAQRAAMQTLVRESFLKSGAAQVAVVTEVAVLQQVLDATPIDEAKAEAQLDRVLDAERQVKRAQLALMIGIKNRLTPEQRARLDQQRSGNPSKGSKG